MDKLESTAADIIKQTVGAPEIILPAWSQSVSLVLGFSSISDYHRLIAILEHRTGKPVHIDPKPPLDEWLAGFWPHRYVADRE